MCQVCLFYFFVFLSKLSSSCEGKTGHDVSESRNVYSVVRFPHALLQILEPCLRLAKAVSWTTNFGFAMMQ